MTDWRDDPTLEAQCSKDKRAAVQRERAEALALPFLSNDAIDRIINSAKLKLAKDCPKVELAAVLERLAHRAIHSEAFNGDALSVADAEKMLRVWDRMHSPRKDVRARAEAEMHALHARVRDHGVTGRAPSPFEKSNWPFFADGKWQEESRQPFEWWLADVAWAYGVERKLMEKCLSPSVFKATEIKAQRISDTLAKIGKRRAPRRSLDGGRRADRERDLRTVKLLAVFYLFFGVEPNGAIADAKPVRGGTRSSDPADGGAATRFVHAFENELARIIQEQALTDPTRAAGRPSRWKSGETATEGAVNIRIRRLIDWRTDNHEELEAPARAHKRPWLKWSLDRLRIA